MKRLFLLLSVLFFTLTAEGASNSSFVKNWGLHKSVVQECLRLGVDPRVVVAIRWIESYKLNGTVYPYAVRVNSGLSKLKDLEFSGVKRVSKHVFVCSSRNSCVEFVKKLISLGVVNFDAGLYQINYLHNGDKFRNYPEDVFDRIESGKFVCRYVAEKLKKYGFHANAVAFYHSFQKERNEKYAEKFYSVYDKLVFSGVKRGN
ncbi:hypothetical protein [Desulfurobacterium sp.]|uniref:hypothetical protein n=1 Tax=Desulfurobacterium sp. TaxID=2004706 RepID=UPI00261EEEA1|nr:hypothetical protein [Desulfurobacterium sp.]